MEMLSLKNLFASPTLRSKSVRRKPRSVSAVFAGLENYEERMMLSATVATVEPAAAATADFSGTWNLTASSGPTGTVVIVQTDANASADVDIAGINASIEGTVKGNKLKMTSSSSIGGVEVKTLKAKLTDETHFKGKTVAIVDGIGKVKVKFTGDLATEASN